MSSLPSPGCGVEGEVTEEEEEEELVEVVEEGEGVDEGP